MKHLKFLQIAGFMIALFFASANLLNAQTCINTPNINGSPCVGCAPTNWVPYNETPDLINGNGAWPGNVPGYDVLNVNNASTSGGAMGLFLADAAQPSLNGFSESWSTSLNGLVIGQQYQVAVEWQQATLTTDGATPPYSGGQLRMGVSQGASNNTFATYSSNGGLTDVWQTATYVFTAASTSATFVAGIQLPVAGLGAIVIDAGSVCSLVPTCNAGTAAPALSSTTKANVCPATTVNLTTITASNLPSGTTLTWHTGTPATTANKVTGTAVAAGTYYAAFFDATNDCYSGTSGAGTTAVTATVSTCTTPVTTGTPATITGSTGTTVTGNPPTGVSGGTSPYTYADGTGDALCTGPTSPTLALPAGRIVSLVGSTGAHNINTVGLGAGTYEYCIKVCDSSGTNCAVSKHTIVVTAACNAGSAAPALIKN